MKCQLKRLATAAVALTAAGCSPLDSGRATTDTGRSDINPELTASIDQLAHHLLIDLNLVIERRDDRQ
jgi:hypothetical protein